jgi:hypothetical protein
MVLRPIVVRVILALVITPTWLHYTFGTPELNDAADYSIDTSLFTAFGILVVGLIAATVLLIRALVSLWRGSEGATTHVLLSLAAFGAPAATWMASALA